MRQRKYIDNSGVEQTLLKLKVHVIMMSFTRSNFFDPQDT